MVFFEQFQIEKSAGFQGVGAGIFIRNRLWKEK